MRKLLVIGIGAGNPDHITVQAINALNRADVFFLFDKGERADDLARIRKDICERFIEEPRYRFVEIQDPVRDPSTQDYKSRVLDWHRERANRLASVISAEVAEDQCGAFLVWGDPSLYDSTLRILHLIQSEGALAFDYEVIPGISSIQVLAAQHKLALNTIGEAIHVTTGRKVADGLPDDATNVVVMLDSGTGLRAAAAEDFDIHWGAYLGTPDEVLVSGKLREVIDEIEEIRAREKAEKGWIMDTYLLRRGRGD